METGSTTSPTEASYAPPGPGHQRPASILAPARPSVRGEGEEVAAQLEAADLGVQRGEARRLHGHCILGVRQSTENILWLLLTRRSGTRARL